MNPSTVTARALVAALPRLGVTDVVLCAGSRSAPLAYALAAAERSGLLRLHVRHDERSAGFTALGVGRAGALAAVVTTSGTAVANLHPAVLEAHHGGVPLLVIAADRPQVWRGTWANQTSDLQSALFGAAVRFRADLRPEGPAGEAVAALGQAVRAARGRRHGARPGPAHLNVAFDDPLVPDDEVPPAQWPGTEWPEAEWPEAEWPEAEPGRLSRPGEPVSEELAVGPRTVVVAGDGATSVARRLAEAAGWPLLAEPTSGARSGPNAVAVYRLLLEHGHLGGAVERAVVLGRPTLSRPVTALLARDDVEVVQVSDHPDDPAPLRPVRRIVGSMVPERVCDESRGVRGVRDDAWLRAWQAAGGAAARAVDAVLDVSGPSGPLLARELWASLSPAEHLVVAASNPVRDLDLAGHPRAHEMVHAGTTRSRVLANRGLSGIDGTVSTAVGVAASTNTRTRVLLGDLAFLHDLGGLVVPAAERRIDVQVVVLDDDGGGIFGLLEHGEPAHAASFERVFGTPHGADLPALARGLGVAVTTADDVRGLRAVLADPAPGLSVVHVPVRRDGLRALHQRLRAAVSNDVERMAEGAAGT